MTSSPPSCTGTRSSCQSSWRRMTATQVRKYFERPTYFFLALLTSKYSDVNLIVRLYSAEGAGGKFAGPSIRTILAETNLVELGRRLPDNIGGQVMEYLGSIWRLYCVSMAKKLCEHWDNYIADFSAAFLVMYYHEELLQNPPKFQVNCTLKVHCIMDHLGDYFLETGQTLRNVADDFVEVFHQQLRFDITYQYILSKYILKM